MRASPSDPAPFMLLDAPAGDGGAPFVLLRDPVAVIEAWTTDAVAEGLRRVDEAIESGLHAAGFLAYECGFALEPSLHAMMPVAHRLPLLWFGLYATLQQLDHAALDDLSGRKADVVPAALDAIRPELDRSAYLPRFDAVRQLIAAGDIYQLNLAIPVSFTWQGAPLDLYRRLHARQPVAHGGLLQTAQFAVLSLSPELFFEVGGGTIRTRPMKGTMRRGITPDEDRQLARALQQDEKNRAENLMIVDLMRNDISRVCEAGSVFVSDLYRIEALPTLFQMTSGVEGRLRSGMSFAALVRALFPAGSITGAPKIRAMEVISALEQRPREVYTGMMGLVSRDGAGGLKARFSVAIRTLTLFPDHTGETFVGSGIVQDSLGDAEYEECLLKQRFLMLPDYQLIETLRLAPDRSYYLLERHLARLARSSVALGFACPLDAIEAELERMARTLEPRFHRVRVVLAAEGTFAISSAAIDEPDARLVIPLVISDKQVDSSDALIRHKTTRRALYDDEWTRWHELKGAGEVLFLNERGEVAEGARSNLFVEKGCELLTPPLDCGLLPGTLREELIATGKVREAVLTPGDLASADALYIGNSVRGLQLALLRA